MSDFLSLLRRRFEQQRDMPIAARLRDNVSYLASLAGRVVWLRNCDEVGPWTRVIGGRALVENQGRIEIGERTSLVCDFAPVELRTARGGLLQLGNKVVVNFGTTISAAARVKVGDRVSIAPYCIVSDADVPNSELLPGERPQAVEIGDDVWLASRVTVLPGARIGARSVITAGSVVAGEIPNDVVAGGNPARVLRHIRAATGQSDAASSGRANGASRDDAPARVASVARPTPSHRGILISDFTIDELVRCLETSPDLPIVSAEPAPFGQVVPMLMEASHTGHDYAVVWTRPEGAVPEFQRLLEFETVELSSLLEQVDAFASLLQRGLDPYRFAFVPSWTLPSWRRGLGLADAKANGVTRALGAMNQRLIDKLADSPNVFVLNAQRWMEAVGQGAHSPKLWYLGKVPFHSTVFEHAALEIKAAIAGLAGMARKIAIVDLDDTLWGGIVGDAGWENLRLGGHDSEGEAFVDFQRGLKALKRRGVVLAIVSKNDESVALEAIRSHPEMVLREDDFVAWRINWQDKAANIADLVASLNLGLQSAVFIDDNPFERTRVREALPEVFVPDWPEDVLAYPRALHALRCFDAPQVSREDLERTELYASEGKREKLRAQVGSIEEWLKSLDIRVRAEPLGAANLARTTQLLNKTNQMNLTTRRLTESELSAWAREPNRWLYALSVSDRLGDAGLTGILSIEADAGTARIVDFVLSCRVMGRKVEETMAHLAVDTARRNSLARVVADYLPTKKNKPCLEFWQRSNFGAEQDSRFSWDVGEAYALPEMISLDRPN